MSGCCRRILRSRIARPRCHMGNVSEPRDQRHPAWCERGRVRGRTQGDRRTRARARFRTRPIPGSISTRSLIANTKRSSMLEDTESLGSGSIRSSRIAINLLGGRGQAIFVDHTGRPDLRRGSWGGSPGRQRQQRNRSAVSRLGTRPRRFCGVHGEVPADHLPMEHRRRSASDERRTPVARPLSERRGTPGRPIRRDEPVRHVRPGGQRRGMVSQ